MSHTPHELADEFPADSVLIHRLKAADAHFARLARLKAADAHFARLAARHHDINREVHRIEAGVEAAGDERLEALKKERLALLDQISAELSRARTA
ncbi:MAG: DUF465 domain-containing protein [Porphyrobacter sp.]|nr:DUF465 domain-containing protein [Porphyrobacter sp.]